MASTQRFETRSAADAEFQRFLLWRAGCQERIEQMDDGAIPSHFFEHVSHYRYARACAVMDRAANPESEGVEAVRRWLHASHAKND